MKIVKKMLSLLLCAALLLSAVPAMADDAVTYTSLYASEVTTLNYLVTSSENEFAIAANLIDTLIEYDRFGRQQPSLAKSWEHSEDICGTMPCGWTVTARFMLL